MIKVLVVEDSRVTRDYIVSTLEADGGLRVAAAVESGEAALDRLVATGPDVILMDVHLPGIDGIETTRRIMTTFPVPIVVCTASSCADDAQFAMRALEAGALAVLKKPSGPAEPSAEGEARALVTALRLMSEVKVVRRWNRAPAAPPSPRPVRPEPAPVTPFDARVVAIGASTGGPPVVQQILSRLTPAFPLPILVVQHIAAGFVQGYTDWLAQTTGMPAHVAADRQVALAGHVYVAPDERHLLLGANGWLLTGGGAPDQGHRPSVDALFGSVADHAGARAIGVLLTGMGRDGVAGLKRMADRGALTVAQSRETCVVFGMPGEAVQAGAARYVLSPSAIADLLLSVAAMSASKGERHGN